MAERSNKEIAGFYDEYVQRQKKHGVNSRHRSIINKLKHEGLRSNFNVLEIGCGIGTLTGLLSDAVSSGKLVAADISPKSIETARNLLSSKKNIEFVVTDMSDFRSATKFDCVVLPDVLEHIPVENHDALFKTIRSVIKEDSFIAIHIPNPYYIEWARVNRPHIMQIIDQSIYSNELLRVVYKNDLYLEKLVSYSLSTEQNDYQWIVLRPNRKHEYKERSSISKMWLSLKLRLGMP
jgi:trans-aconitate 2-methyltransferase